MHYLTPIRKTLIHFLSLTAVNKTSSKQMVDTMYFLTWNILFRYLSILPGETITVCVRVITFKNYTLTLIAGLHGDAC